MTIVNRALFFQPLCSIFPNWHNRRLEATALASPSLASKRAPLNLGVSQLRLWACAVKTDPHVDSRCDQKGVATVCGPYQGIWSKKNRQLFAIFDIMIALITGQLEKVELENGNGKWKWKRKWKRTWKMERVVSQILFWSWLSSSDYHLVLPASS